MIRSEKLDKILPAIYLVKKELEAVKKNSKNPFFKNKYANLNDHLDMVEPLLEKNGCFLIQPTQTTLGTESTYSETLIIHAESGQFIGGSMALLVGKPDMQQLGAAATYARRFVLSGLLAMKAEDDDGNTATGKATTDQASTKPTPRTTSSSGGFKSGGGGFGRFKKAAETTPEISVEKAEGDIY